MAGTRGSEGPATGAGLAVTGAQRWDRSTGQMCSLSGSESAEVLKQKTNANF